MNNINIDCFKYMELVNAYKTNFDVRVFLYEQLKDNPDSVVSSLNLMLNTNWSVKSSTKVNSSISKFQMNVKRGFNIIGSGTSNNLIQKASLLFVKLLPKFKNVTADRDIDELIGDYYLHNNRELHSTYPDIGIEQFPTFYEM